MKSSNTVQFLQRERGRTDSSLTSERGKTDESLFDLQRNIERETDEKVKLDRTNADQAKKQSRIKVDKEKDLIRQAARIDDSVKDIQLQHSVDARTDEERRRNDQVMALERDRIDVALQNERDIKDAATLELLGAERGETDVSLKQERQTTDSGIQATSKRFTEEQASHTLTKAALTTRDEFLAIVSHDLRNPIGSTLSFAELILDHPMISEGNAEMKSWVEIIKRNSESALRLINDLLDMERLAEGKLVLNLNGHSLDEIVHSSVKSFAPLAKEKGIQLKIEGSDFPFKVLCDRERIEQILSNLIGNALKFTPEGGVVVLQVKQNENESEVSIADTGPGIPDDEKKRIFERFAQIGKKDRRGLGLGLYISNMLVEAHQGKLWVESSSGRGSIFSFSFLTRIQDAGLPRR